MDEREAIVAFLRREAERYSNAARAAEHHPVWRVRCTNMAEAAGDLAFEVERGTHLDDES
jgi:hypothetical protein